MKLNAATRLSSTVCGACGGKHKATTASTVCEAARTQEWFTKLEESAKKRYVKKFPGSGFLRHPHI
jgi:hypothetical protein